MEIVIPPEVLALLERRAILRAEVEKAIEDGETRQAKFAVPAAGRSIAFHSSAGVTYWVEYSVDGSRFMVQNAYSHRMKIGAGRVLAARDLAAAARVTVGMREGMRENESPQPGTGALMCTRCNQAMAPGKCMATYLGYSFPLELVRCPTCKNAHVPEALATGKILQVEQLLEDK